MRKNHKFQLKTLRKMSDSAKMVEEIKEKHKMSFIDGIKEQAKKQQKTIILPESEDERTLKAAQIAKSEGLAKVILLGDPNVIAEDAKKWNVDLTDIEIVNPETDTNLENYIQTLYELRKAKGMTLEAARQALLTDRTTFGVMMIKCGHGDGLVSGACHSTANTLRPALQILKTAPNAKLVSGFFVVDVPNCQFGENGTFVFADCGLNQDPDAEQLAAIAYDSSKSFANLVGKTPKVAFLSHSSKGSAKHALVDKVATATKIAQEQYPDMLSDGELQLDAAIVPEVAASKAPNSKVAGQANVLIFPNLDAGNIGYKLVQRLAKADAYGPILQGIAKPVNDLSRGCSYLDIVGVIAITAVQAQNQ